jgi:enamine deaminase RidA (YjgF/YER057c/UK114 family)
MAHKRIRVGNTKGGHLAPDLDYGSSQAVVAGDQVFLVGCTGLTLDGKNFVGEGDPAAQAETAMQNVRTLLEKAGARMEDICMITNYTTEHSHRAQVYPVIARHLEGVNPVSTGLVVKSLASPYIDFEIDVWAVIPKNRTRGHDRYRLLNARGGYLMPNLDFGNSKIVRANDHLFLQGQTGMTLDGKDFIGEGDPAKQAQAAMENVRELLADVGATISDVCKITTYITDPSYREGIYRVLAEHFRDVSPVSTGTIVKALARPELDFEIDVFAMVPDDKSKGHDRFRLGDSNYLPELNYRLSKVVRAGNFLFLQGQTGLALDGSGLVGRGDPAVQADEAMMNVRTLLEESGSRMEDICKVTVYVTDMADRAAIYPVLGRHLRGVNPVSTGIVLEALANPELDFEIDVFAAIG